MVKLKNIVVGFFAVMGLLFILIMLLPDGDEEELPEATRAETSEAYEAETEGEEDHSADRAEEREENHNNDIADTGIQTVTVGTGAKTATIMIYMNGSDLETKAGEATRDISEMLSSGVGENVNVIIQTMGTKKWHDYGISSQTAQTYRIKNGELLLLRDELGQLSCTAADTLSEFIGYCKEEFPADRYILVLWDHGGGPVYGFGYDEWQPEEEGLTIAEMAEAFSENKDIHFDIIGMDCCIMANMETCYVLAPYCKYALLSEDFESGLGWSYTGWMKRFEEAPGVPTPLLGKYIVDDIIQDNENSPEGDSACVSLFNVSTSRRLFEAWEKYAYKNEAALLNMNYSRRHMSKGRAAHSFWDLWSTDESNVTLSDYYITDMLALIESVDKDSDEAKTLMSALKAAVAYYGHTSDKNELTGLAVSLPYGDPWFYKQLKNVYQDLGFGDEYLDWLKGFTAGSPDEYFDFEGFESSWSGWSAYEGEYGCNLSSGGSCEYAYDYDDGDQYRDDIDSGTDDWIYDYEEELWYLYEDDILYLYDEESEMLCYYDEGEDEIYYYDEYDDEWYLMEDQEL
ncbi:MAG: hypothetical protein J5966_03690 [Lachnospiraceae bacterium]|nr:hypothetical protein [Lachnospiraceae bacterium]